MGFDNILKIGDMIVVDTKDQAKVTDQINIAARVRMDFDFARILMESEKYYVVDDNEIIAKISENETAWIRVRFPIITTTVSMFYNMPSLNGLNYDKGCELHFKNRKVARIFRLIYELDPIDILRKLERYIYERITYPGDEFEA